MYEQELATATSIPDVLEDFLLLFHHLLIKVGARNSDIIKSQIKGCLLMRNCFYEKIVNSVTIERISRKQLNGYNKIFITVFSRERKRYVSDNSM